MPKKIEPKFTQAQAGAIRVALKTLLEEEWDGVFKATAARALRELDQTELATRRPRDP